MANTYTGTADITNQTGVSNLVQTAYDRMVEFALRSQPTFRAVADKRPAQQSMPGSSVVLELYQDLSTATGTLTENVDPDAVALSNTTTVTVTLNEYGSATLATRKLDLFAFANVEPAIANIVAYNMIDSLDSVVQTELRGGSQFIREIAGTAGYNTGTLTSMVATDTFKTKHVRLAVAKLRAQNVMPRKGSLYVCYLHPEVSHDLRAEAGSNAGWRDPHVYSAPDAIWAGEIGAYEGAYFIETPRCYNAVDSGASSTTIRNFRSYFLGMQALAEVVAEEPHLVLGPVTDKLMRTRPVGWYGVLGWKRYRSEALLRVETTSSIHSS